MSAVSSVLASLGLTAEAIAERTSLPVDRVRALLAGGSARLSEIRALSAGLRVPKQLFSPRRDKSALGNLQFQFRSTNKSDSNFNPTVERVASFVEAALSLLPARQHPPEILGQSTVEPSYSSAQLLAARYRNDFVGNDTSSPLLNLPDAIASIDGVILSLIKESRFEAISLLKSNYLFLFVSPRFPARMLFSVAHELAHVAAGHVREDTPLFEGASAIGNFRKSRVNERFCDAFAGNLLLTDEGLLGFLSITRRQLNIPASESLGDIEILLLARFYGVSFDVAAKRCEDLGLLPEGGAISLVDHLKKHHKSPERRANDLGLPERAKISFPAISPFLAELLQAGLAEGDISSGWASDHFNLSISELMSLNQTERIL
jgi:Zn-dependent peptidase ImmA (M78 family)